MSPFFDTDTSYLIALSFH